MTFVNLWTGQWANVTAEGLSTNRLSDEMIKYSRDRTGVDILIEFESSDEFFGFKRVFFEKESSAPKLLLSQLQSKGKPGTVLEYHEFVRHDALPMVAIAIGFKR